jgi:acetoacetyl-CoA synthetase
MLWRDGMKEGDLIWTPDQQAIDYANETKYARWLNDNKGLSFNGYADLWQWSVDNIEDFWESIWQYFNVKSSASYDCVLVERKMPGADWFPGSHLNYAENVLRNESLGGTAIMHCSETRAMHSMSWAELGSQVRKVATQLRDMGVGKGDLVAAYMPNIVEAAVAMLATTSLGAIWSSCSPDFGTRNVVDRFSQLKPKVLFCVDGYTYRGKAFSRLSELEQILSALDDSLEHIVFMSYLDVNAPFNDDRKHLWSDLMAAPEVSADDFEFAQVPFSHPLWVLFSSGTTGLPKGIVHSHGGIILEQMKLSSLHMDMHEGEKVFFYTTTGWMMWNFLVSAMLLRAIPVLYDGNPTYPEVDQLWSIAEEADITMFGTSPTYVLMQEKAGVRPVEKFNLPNLRVITLAGSPSSPANMAWFSQNVKPNLWVSTGSGGTDVCTGFTGGSPTIPSYAGEMQCRQLGVDAHSLDEDGNKVLNTVGEMVIHQPMPSMPIYFWNDDGGERYHDSYFSEYPGKWRQGDFFRVNERGGCFVLGRSDATLNRQGIRIGTAEIYRCVEGVDNILDSLIVNLDLPDGKFFMPLFVKLAEGVELNDALKEDICQRLKTEYSPRHVPDQIYQVAEIPSTLTGKKMEVPVRKILMGMDPGKVANVSVMANPSALDYFVEFGRNKTDYPV